MKRWMNEWTNHLMNEQTENSHLSHYVFLCDVPNVKGICPHLQFEIKFKHTQLLNFYKLLSLIIGN